jgi:signal transduction histidine kinase/CheY-like chemotaxis protein/HPt (histidine-containing phosphotransfer) domain-containing protein
MLSPLSLATMLLCNAALTAAVALYAWPRKDVPGARSFAVLNVLATMVSLAYAGYYHAGDVGAQAFWLRIRFAAQVGLPPAALALCLEVSGHGEQFRRRRAEASALFVAVPALFAALAVTNPLHHQFLRFDGGVAAGPGFWALAIYSIIVSTTGLLFLLHRAVRHRGATRWQSLLLLAGIAAPAVLTFVALAVFGRGFLVGPFAFSASVVLFAIAIFRLGFLGLVPVARATVFEEIADGVLVVDSGGRIVDANAAAARLLAVDGTLRGTQADSLLGASWPGLGAALGARSRTQDEFTRGPLRLLAMVTPLPAPAGFGGSVVVLHDVTESRRTQAALESASRARADFLARMSHEFRTPLNGVLGLSGLLLQTPLDDHQRDYARGVRESAQALLRIVNDALDFSRIDAGRLALEASDFEPRASVADAIDLVRAEAEAKGLAVRSTIDADVPFTVSGDVGRVRQVLINLLGNAVKFTPSGEVRVDVAVAPSDRDDVVLRFTVSDSGIGIAPDAHARIFEPFVQADAGVAGRFGGSGLGLPICRQLVELMGGTIDVQSEVGRGSVFTFTVRVARAGLATPIDADASDDETVARQWSGRILVVEDNTVNQMVIARMLEQRGLVADVVASGVEAIDAWSRVPYDLVLMDCRMPEMDGYEATREIRRREQGRRTPIVAMTAAALPSDRERCLDAGMDEHVAKPIRARDLDAALARFLPSAAGAPTTADGGTLDDVRAAMGASFDRVVDAYIADGDAAVAALRTAVERHDEAAAAAVAHRLKGSSAMLGADAIVASCQQIVDDPARAAALLDSLARDFDAVRQRLRGGARETT